MKFFTLCSTLVSFSFLFGSAEFSSAETPSVRDGERAVQNEFKALIPKDKFKNIDDLYIKWLEIQSGASQAVIFDIRGEAEFDSGHIINSNNIAAGRAFAVPQLIANPNAEIWVTCRTQQRAIYFVGMLYKYGYNNVYVVEGGIEAWAKKGYPFASRYLGKIQVIEYHKDFKETYLFRETKSE